MTLSNPLFLASTAGALVWGAAAVAASPPTWRNSLGMEFVKIPAGTFQMGQEQGSWDEQPVHPVTLSEPFWMSVAEVTLEQFRQFQPDFPGTAEAAPAAAGVSWYQAQAFCEWLSRKEGRPYRLPTEAEWEYACRLDPPVGLENLLAGVLEWCLDWYGPYPESPQADPVGPASGLARVVRGGCLDEPGNPAYRRPTCRAGMAPAFGIRPGAGNRFGSHLIGFRLVQAPPPQGSPWMLEPAFVQQGVKQTAATVSWGPDPAKPYFRKRYLLPTPPENSPPEAIETAGLHPAFRGHNHSPALEVCPNGDLLLVIYTSYHEYEPEVSLIASRLRFGAEEWDFPDLLFDFPGVNDHAPLLWNDGGTLHCFWGNPRLTGAFPFQWTSSRDSGATWDEVRFPEFRNQVGPHSRQPINTAFRGLDGTMYVASDGEGGQSLLWVSTDHGRTWIDPGGRTGGRHTTWRNFHCQGTATRWDRSGKVLSQVEFIGQGLRVNYGRGLRPSPV